MKSSKRHDKRELKVNRKALRKKLTPAEAFLWKELKGKKFDGHKFRRQHSIDHYIVDFYCATEKLIIELDGEVHMNPTAAEYDEKRSDYLENMGFTVIRFENKMAFDALPSVLREIKDHLKLKD